MHLLLGRLPLAHPFKQDRVSLLNRFHEIETSICASKPNLKYPSLLSEAYIELTHDLGLAAPEKSEADKFGASVGKWPIFPDTTEALKQLKKYYKLVILSNVDKESFAQVLKGALAGVEFDAVYVAEEIGSYKPDLNNFHYLVKHARDELSVQMEEILMTAHGLSSDHVPTMKMGMTSAVSTLASLSSSLSSSNPLLESPDIFIKKRLVLHSGHCQGGKALTRRWCSGLQDVMEMRH